MCGSAHQWARPLSYGSAVPKTISTTSLHLWTPACWQSRTAHAHISGPQPVDSLVLRMPTSLALSLLTVWCCGYLHLWTSVCWQSGAASPVRLQSAEGSLSFSKLRSLSFCLVFSLFPFHSFSLSLVCTMSQKTRNTQTLRFLKPNRFYMDARQTKTSSFQRTWEPLPGVWLLRSTDVRNRSQRKSQLDSQASGAASDASRVSTYPLKSVTRDHSPTLAYIT